MKKQTIVSVVLILSLLLFSCNKANAQESKPTVSSEGTEVVSADTAAIESALPESHNHDVELIVDQFSYVFGALSAANFSSIGVLPNLEEFSRGFLAAYHGEELEYDQATQQIIIQEFNHLVEDIMGAQAAVALEEGNAFLTEKAKEDGVITSDSGLLYRIVNPGSDKKPTAEDTVTVDYRGTFIDGTEFDSSYSRGVPASFPLSGVIAGWTEGLQYIGEGGSIELFIPSDLAYGQGSASIPPNSVLVFTVELISIDTE